MFDYWFEARVLFIIFAPLPPMPPRFNAIKFEVELKFCTVLGLIVYGADWNY